MLSGEDNPDSEVAHRDIPDAGYRQLAEFRRRIRKFLHFSEQAVQAAGLERGQYQLMLAIKGIPEEVRPRIRELANRMQIQHHSAVELVNRLEAGGFVRRERAQDDRREVLLALTRSRSEERLAESSPSRNALLNSVPARHCLTNADLRERTPSRVIEGGHFAEQGVSLSDEVSGGSLVCSFHLAVSRPSQRFQDIFRRDLISVPFARKWSVFRLPAASKKPLAFLPG